MNFPKKNLFLFLFFQFFKIIFEVPSLWKSTDLIFQIGSPTEKFFSNFQEGLYTPDGHLFYHENPYQLTAPQYKRAAEHGEINRNW